MLGTPENGPEWWLREAGNRVAYSGNSGNPQCAETVREQAGRPCSTASTWTHRQRNTATPTAFRTNVISTAGFLQRSCRGYPLGYFTAQLPQTSCDRSPLVSHTKTTPRSLLFSHSLSSHPRLACLASALGVPPLLWAPPLLTCPAPPKLWHLPFRTGKPLLRELEALFSP